MSLHLTSEVDGFHAIDTLDDHVLSRLHQLLIVPSILVFWFKLNGQKKLMI